ncbi:MAG: hypothetical protein WBC91_16900 [Phototrophicaceae bacterium]
MDNSLLRGLLAGLVLAGVGIGLFFLLYFVILPETESLIRLMVSLIAPPIAMLLLVGGYFILSQDEDAA